MTDWNKFTLTLAVLYCVVDTLGGTYRAMTDPDKVSHSKSVRLAIDLPWLLVIILAAINMWGTP